MKSQENKGQITIDFLISILLFATIFAFIFQVTLGFAVSVSNNIETTHTTNNHITDIIENKVEHNGLDYLRNNDLEDIKSDVKLDDRNPIELVIVVTDKNGNEEIRKGVQDIQELSTSSERIVYDEGEYKRIKVISW